MENHLLAIDFDYHLGCILYNYHEWLVDNGHLPDILLSRMITDYPSVYTRALYDYLVSASRSENAVFTGHLARDVV